MVLVTGGTGFLGAILIQHLVNGGYSVRATKRETADIPVALRELENLTWINADINDYFALTEAFQGVKAVYHCAAQVSYDPRFKKQLFQVNVEGTANIVNLSIEHGVRMLHVSSIAALGSGKLGRLTTEDDQWEADGKQSPYSISKYQAEMEVWRGIAEGLDAVIVNPSLIIGASAAGKGSGSVFALLYRGLKYYTGGSVGLVDVEDVAKTMVMLMEKGSEVSGHRFIVSNVNMRHKELLERSSSLMKKSPPATLATPMMLGLAWRFAALQAMLTGKRPLLTKDAARAASKNLAFSNQKIRDSIGFTFKPIDDTLSEICLAIQKQQH